MRRTLTPLQVEILAHLVENPDARLIVADLGARPRQRTTRAIVDGEGRYLARLRKQQFDTMKRKGLWRESTAKPPYDTRDVMAYQPSALAHRLYGLAKTQKRRFDHGRGRKRTDRHGD